MSQETHNIYEFEDFRLDFAEKTLRRGGEIVPITPKVFETLHLFVENAGHLIEKDELMEKLWQERFVEESNLTFNIKMLRKALGDDATKPTFIETVPTRGYRFIAEVRGVEAVDADAEKDVGLAADSSTSLLPASASSHRGVTSFSHKSAVVSLADWRSETDTTLPDKSTRPAKLESASVSQITKSIPKLAAFVLAGLILGAIALGYYFFFSEGTAVVGKKSVAIMPFNPISTANRDEIYEIGIADSLILKLNSTKGLKVRPLSAIRKYADVEQDTMAAGKEQRVDFVLVSNYQLVNGRIKVTAQLFNVANGQYEGTFTSEHNAADTFKMQDAIAGEVGNKLMAWFGTTSTSPTAERGTTNEEAYRRYLQGMYLYDRRTLADGQKAVGLLEQALQLDPNYARAWAGKAHVHRSLGNFGGNTHEEYRKSIEAINNALALDENLADAHSALCENKFFYDWDPDGAERECKRAIELDANSGRAHDMYARYLYGSGRFDEAIVEIKTAIDLEPTSLFIQRNYGVSLYYARSYAEAIIQFKRVAEIDPNFVATYAWLVPALNVQGNEAEAFEWFMKWQAVLKTDDETVQAYKKEYQTSAWQGVGRERVKRFDEGKIRSYFLEACLTVHTGDKDKAFEYLEKSFQRREWGMSYLHVDPSLDALRTDPRFDDLVRRAESK